MKHQWPAGFGLDPGAVKALEKTLEAPQLTGWPEGEDFMAADEARAIVDVLGPAFHRELVNAKLAILFKEKSTTRGRAPAGKVALLSKRDRFLSGYDFVIVFDHSIWKALNLVQRTALVDHELEHCGVDDGGNFFLVEHDITEFNVTVRRWGAWDAALADFFRAAKPQFEMWEDQTAPLGASK